MNAALSAGSLALSAMRGLHPRKETARGVGGTEALNPKKGRLKELCQEMESIFITVLMRQMRQTVWKSELIPEAAGEDIYRSMWEAEVAGRMEESTGGFGIAKAMYKELDMYKELERQGEWQRTETSVPGTEASVLVRDNQYWSL